MSKNQIDQAVQRTHRYYYDDGLVEIGVGLLFIATGGVLFAWQGIGSSIWITIVLVVGLMAVIAGGTWLLTKGVKAAKERVTFPRTGYVAYREKEPNSGRWWILIAVVLMVVAGYVWPEEVNKMSTAIGGLLAVILAYLGYRVGLRRFYLTALATFLIGLTATASPLEEVVGAAATFGGSGLVLLLAGICAFWSYLSGNPAPVVGENHE